MAFIGDSGVGKTAIISRYIFSKFKNDYSSTIEDFYSTYIKLNQQSDASTEVSKTLRGSMGSNDYYRLDLVDTAGMDELNLVSRSTIKKCEGYVFVYDVN